MEEKLAELEGLSDSRLVRKLEEEAATLWPRRPELISGFRSWLDRAQEVRGRLPRHRQSLLRVRQEAYLNQVVAGLIVEGEGTEPLWDQADSKLAWRFDLCK